MKQNEIILQFYQSPYSFIDFIYSPDGAQFVHNRPNKWSAGQPLEHIYLSIKPGANGAKSTPQIYTSDSRTKQKRSGIKNLRKALFKLTTLIKKHTKDELDAIILPIT